MRHFQGHQWATTAGGIVRVAFVAKPEMVDPQKFGVTVATNFGADADVFTCKAEALAWLNHTDY